MKRAVLGICFGMVVVAISNLISVRAQDAGRLAEQATSNDAQAPTKNWAAGNPLKIGLLKWYQANLVPLVSPWARTQNSNPYGIAFDGANIWTANNGDGTVSKLRASDGATLGTFTVGGQPNGVVFRRSQRLGHGESEHGEQAAGQRRQDPGQRSPWGARPGGQPLTGRTSGCQPSDGVTKLRASDGKNLGTFAVPAGRLRSAFDGKNIWVTGYGADTVTKMRKGWKMS